ncbi:hypothetical protein FRACYDRAFT_249336 [Fragilariopsis cylindrus CCMP1102]|uniref:DUF1275-domain-containing protein n=1 Tax=Fragilariopsis cylindrus CCMP1102 TaxID=635003 RepID=A0A1E7ESP7_9STRA|nr:hypothetical protein FRACYDRAFT_249336 [Fragilariopsis cylindrus CCMP1102]|eukprot:OEU08991.1 hypothetical protein FRACYDRAFT_249336 [Fragilariopsis cylindrus CCMP1102]
MISSSKINNSLIKSIYSHGSSRPNNYHDDGDIVVLIPSPPNDDGGGDSDRTTAPANTSASTNANKCSKTTLINSHTRHEYIFIIGIGMCMAFIAGYSNGVCLSGNIFVGSDSVSLTVTGVTGLYTNSAIELLNLRYDNSVDIDGSDIDESTIDGKRYNDLQQYKFYVCTILSVMVGSCISSIMNPHPVAFELSPRYGPTFLIGGIFTSLGAYMSIKTVRFEFYFTAIGNGIMNGISSMYTANLIRTTHLTGTTTDIGLFIGQLIRGNTTNLWKLYILGGLATSFWLGSICGVVVSDYIGRFALLVNAVVFFIFGFTIIIYFILEHNFTLWEAIITGGTYFEKKNEKNEDSNSNDLLLLDEEENIKMNDNNKISTLEYEKKLMNIFDELSVLQDVLHTILFEKEKEEHHHHHYQQHQQQQYNDGIIMTNGDDNYDNEHDNWTIQRDQWERVVKEQCSCRPHIASAAGAGANSTKRRSSSPAIITTATSTATTANILSCYDGAVESMDMMRIISIREIESHGYKMKAKEQNK